MNSALVVLFGKEVQCRMCFPWSYQFCKSMRKSVIPFETFRCQWSCFWINWPSFRRDKISPSVHNSSLRFKILMWSLVLDLGDMVFVTWGLENHGCFDCDWLHGRIWVESIKKPCHFVNKAIPLMSRRGHEKVWFPVNYHFKSLCEVCYYLIFWKTSPRYF